MTRVASRLQDIEPFRVMQILARARAMEAVGRDVVHMEIGEPDFDSPPAVVEAGRRALADGHTHYTPATGLPALREAIAGHYRDRYGVEVDPGRIIVTPGASGALQLVLGTLLDPGDGLLLTDPGYPCNRHMALMLGALPRALPLDVARGFRLAPDAIRGALDERTRALLVASPANPTGQVMTPRELADCYDALDNGRRAALVVDEIYQGLQYGGAGHTALALGEEGLFVVNSFSKYFGMTGWRLGWAVVPPAFIDAMDRLAQNLFLAAPTMSQHAALAAFESPTLALLEERREAFRARRDRLVEGLEALGLVVAAVPEGAFYVYADVGDYPGGSLQFCADLLEQHGVASTPGTDFGVNHAERYVRFAYTTAIDRIDEGLRRIAAFLSGVGRGE